MDIALSFLPLLQVFAAEMTQPSMQTLRTLISGWVFAPRRTILGMVRGSGTQRHHAAFHRLFAAASWSLDRVGLALFDRITRGLDVVFLVGDDTLLSRRGLKVFAAGMHRDPLLSSRSHTVTRWGHCWVVLGVVFESRWVPGRRFVLPVLCRLYANKDAAAKWGCRYRKKTELLLEMLALLQEHSARSGKQLHFLGDSAYTAPAVLAQIPAAIAVTGRVVANVRMCAAPPPRRKGQRGRPRKRGERLPTPAALLAHSGLARLELELYEGRPYRMRVAEQLGRFYKAPERAVKVVAVEHLSGGRGVEVFYTTQTQDAAGAETKAETVLSEYSWRWPIEVTFHDAKQHLGVDQPQNWSSAAVRRTAPVGFLLYSLIVLWHETLRSEPAPALRTWSHKRAASFADMLAALRLESLENAEQTLLLTPGQSPGVQKILNQLKMLLALAA